MSDEKLRELERRFKETGSVEDEAVWLKERVRVGDLTQERLELAAALGAVSAALAMDEPRQEPPEDRAALMSILRESGDGALARGAIAVARAVLPAWISAWPEDDRPVKAIEAAEAWLDCPCDKHAEESRVAGTEVYRTVGGGGAPLAAGYAARAAHHAAMVARAGQAFSNAAKAGLSETEMVEAVYLGLLSR